MSATNTRACPRYLLSLAESASDAGCRRVARSSAQLALERAIRRHARDRDRERADAELAALLMRGRRTSPSIDYDLALAIAEAAE
jgi:hypothetical protein